MRRTLALAVVPATLALAACGGGADQNVTLTNDSNVVLNDATANYAYSNDGEMTANDSAAMEATNTSDMNAAAPANDMAMGNDGI